MKIIFGFFIFCLILFIYLHIQFHLKKSDELEIYEMETVSKEKLEEVCDVRQPVIFDFDNEKLMELTTLSFLQDNYPSFEVKVRNTLDHDKQEELYMPVPLNDAVQLFKQDKQSHYYTENNKDFLQETAATKNFQYNDAYLRPAMMSNSQYDFMTGSKHTKTPFRYELNYRNYFLVTQGSIQVKLAPPKSVKYLYPEYDYENFEFSSPVDPWSVQPKYKADFNKIKCLEFTLTKGKTLFLPAFWWYSFQFEEPSTSVSCFRYRTYMNNAAISPYIFLYALQLQNIQRKTTHKLQLSELSSSSSSSSNTILQKDKREKQPQNKLQNKPQNKLQKKQGKKGDAVVDDDVHPDHNHDMTNENLETSEIQHTEDPYIQLNDVNNNLTMDDILPSVGDF